MSKLLCARTISSGTLPSEVDLGGANGGTIESVSVSCNLTQSPNNPNITLFENGSSGDIILDLQVSPTQPFQAKFDDAEYSGQLHVTIRTYDTSITVEVG